MLTRLAPVVAIAACFLAAGGCAHLTAGVVPSATPTPAATATSAAGTCSGTPAANAQLIAISPLVTPTTDPTYGVIGGYGLVTTGNSSNVAAPIVIAASSVVQFFNNDDVTSQLRYSAVGIAGANAFPAPSFTFPPSAIAQTGTQINKTTTWSTGLLAGQCYSQTFTIAAPGTYYFGDYNYYGLANIRDVIVATSSP